MAEGQRDALVSIETRVLRLSCGIICVILHLDVFIRCQSVTDTHTETDRRMDRHTTTAYTVLCDLNLQDWTLRDWNLQDLNLTDWKMMDHIAGLECD